MTVEIANYVVDIEGQLVPSIGDEVRIFNLTNDEFRRLEDAGWPHMETGDPALEVLDKAIAEGRVWGFIPHQVFDR